MNHPITHTAHVPSSHILIRLTDDSDVTQDPQHPHELPGGVQAHRARKGQDVRLRSDRLRRHPHGPRQEHDRIRHGRQVPEVLRLRGHPRHQLHRRGRQDHRPRRAGGRGAPGALRKVHPEVLRGLRQAGDQPRRHLPQGERVHRRHHINGPEDHRQRLRLRRRGRQRLLRRREDGRRGQAHQPHRRPDAVLRQDRRGPLQEEPAGLRRLEGRQARGGLLGLALGQGQAGMAHRVLRHDLPLPRRADRHPRRRERPDLPAPGCTTACCR